MMISTEVHDAKKKRRTATAGCQRGQGDAALAGTGGTVPCRGACSASGPAPPRARTAAPVRRPCTSGWARPFSDTCGGFFFLHRPRGKGWHAQFFCRSRGWGLPLFQKATTDVEKKLPKTNFRHLQYRVTLVVFFADRLGGGVGQ